MSRRTKQLDLFAQKARRSRRRRGVARGTHGKNAKNAKNAKDGFLPHVARPEHRKEHPVHVSMRRVPMAPSFRAQRICAAIVGQISDAKRRNVRVIEYSIQDNHLHLIIEGSSSADLSNQMRKLFSRIAFAVNAAARRSGKLFRDRHHRHELRTPTEVRNALVYVLFNDRKHASRGHASNRTAATADTDLDLCSSALWFTNWDPSIPLPPFTYDEMKILASDMERPTVKPETWLARVGWRRAGGPIRFNERPRAER